MTRGSSYSCEARAFDNFKVSVKRELGAVGGENKSSEGKMSSNSLPFEVKEVEGEKYDEMKKLWTGLGAGFAHIGPEKLLMPRSCMEYAERIYNFKARPDDVYTCTFPRSGTTWTQEMIWLICNDLDYEGALKEPLNERFPYFEYENKFFRL